jgi:hypothetical protein
VTKPKPKAPTVPVVQVVPSPVEPRRQLWQAMFFTKDGRLDLGWLLLAICCAVGLTVFAGQALKLIPKDAPSKEAWGWFAVFTGFAFIGGAARDRAVLIAKGNVIGNVVGALGGQSNEESKPGVD